MTPQQAHAAAVTELADLLARTHDDPHDAANRYIGGLVRSGWHYVPQLADRPLPARPAPPTVAHAALAEARAEVGRKKRAREEREAGT